MIVFCVALFTLLGIVLNSMSNSNATFSFPTPHKSQLLSPKICETRDQPGRGSFLQRGAYSGKTLGTRLIFLFVICSSYSRQGWDKKVSIFLRSQNTKGIKINFSLKFRQMMLQYLVCDKLIYLVFSYDSYLNIFLRVKIQALRGHSQRISKPIGVEGGLENQGKLGHRGKVFF
jgi:hypothetical protein